jgi:hypothetical protein
LVGSDPANKTNQTNQINQINEIDQKNELEALGNDLPPETPHILTAGDIAKHQRQIQRHGTG